MPEPTPAEAAAAGAARGRVGPPGPLGDARGRSGPFTRADALAAGHTPGAIRVRLRRGDWRRVRTGVYVVRAEWDAAAGNPASAHALRVFAALRVVSAAVASGTSAAILHGLTLPGPPPVAVVLTRARAGLATPAKLPGIELQVAAVPAHHVTVSHGIAVTTVARTLVDLARAMPFRDAVMLLDAALHQRRCTVRAISAVLADCAGWPEVRTAARAVAFADPAAESPLESASRVFFAAHGIAAPRTQHWLGDEGGRIGRVDFCWPDHRTVGEADGLGKYAEASVLRAEKLRQERLEQAGFVVVRFTWRDVTDRPLHTAARIRAAFARGDLTLASEGGYYSSTGPAGFSPVSRAL